MPSTTTWKEVVASCISVSSSRLEVEGWEEIPSGWLNGGLDYTVKMLHRRACKALKQDAQGSGGVTISASVKKCVDMALDGMMNDEQGGAGWWLDFITLEFFPKLYDLVKFLED